MTYTVSSGALNSAQSSYSIWHFWTELLKSYLNKTKCLQVWYHTPKQQRIKIWYRIPSPSSMGYGIFDCSLHSATAAIVNTDEWANKQPLAKPNKVPGNTFSCIYEITHNAVPYYDSLQQFCPPHMGAKLLKWIVVRDCVMCHFIDVQNYHRQATVHKRCCLR